MNNKEKDKLILRKVVMYCKQAMATMAEFGNDEAVFSKSFTFKNACAMCILQIGELAGKLSEEAQADMK